MTATQPVPIAFKALMPFVNPAAIDELALHLSGLSGEAHIRECLRLTNAIVEAMQAEGDIGVVEIAVVLTTLQAAVIKAKRVEAGHA